MITTIKKTLISLVFFFIFFPIPALAASHTYTCADSLNYAGTNPPTCGFTDKFSFGGTSSIVVDDIIPELPVSPSTQYYVSFTIGTTNGVTMQIDDGSVILDYVSTASSQSELPLANLSGGSPVAFNFGATAGHSFVGDFTGFCIDDDGVSCTGGGGGGSTLFTWNYHSASTLVDNQGIFTTSVPVGNSKILFQINNNGAAGGGVEPGIFPYDNINNMIFANYGATTTTDSWVCWHNASVNDCDITPSHRFHFSASVTGYASSTTFSTSGLNEVLRYWPDESLLAAGATLYCRIIAQGCLPPGIVALGLLEPSTFFNS